MMEKMMTTMAATTDEEETTRPLLTSRRGRANWPLNTILAGVGFAGTVMALVTVAARRMGLGEVPHTWKPGDGRPLLAPRPTNTAPSVTYKLHTLCRDERVRTVAAAAGDFFLDGAFEPYLVRHNYGSSSFFKKEEGIKMNSYDFSDVEKGYSLTTTKANFEYGFALKNTKTGKWLYEIGDSHSALAKLPCTQRYGNYFNRLLTVEEDKTNIEYVFGSCNSTCEGYTDTSYTTRATSGSIPNCPDSSMVIGQTEDARLVTIRSMQMGGDATYKAGMGRALVSRDTQYENESENEVQWIMHGITPYWHNDGSQGKKEVKMAAFKVIRSPATNNVAICKASSKAWIRPGGSLCSGKNCYSGSLDIPALWRDTANHANENFNGFAPVATVARKGDARPDEFTFDAVGSNLLNNDVILTAEQMGTVVDARRVILLSGSPCGDAVGCIRTLLAEPDSQVTPTKSVKYWILGVASGHGVISNPGIKMVRIKVYVDGSNNIRAQAVEAKNGNADFIYRNVNNLVQQDEDGDVYRMPVSISAHWYLTGSTVVASLGVPTTVSGSGLNAGSLTFLLAPEMVPSLAENTPTPQLTGY